MKNDLFYTYLRLYPGKADVIRTAMDRGYAMAKKNGITGSEADAYAESEILDALD